MCAFAFMVMFFREQKRNERNQMNNEFGMGKSTPRIQKSHAKITDSTPQSMSFGTKLPLVPIGCAHRRFHFGNHADDDDDNVGDDFSAATAAEDGD